MPIYEFRCRKCGYTFEHLVFPSDKPEAIPCPLCAAKNPCKLMSSFSCSTSSTQQGADASHSCASHGGFS